MSNKQTDFQDGELRVVVNGEEQYSIWPMERDIPAGWIEIGFTGSKADCLEHIKKVWTDLRPMSLRKHMKELDGNRANSKNNERIASDNDREESEEKRPDLVEFLSTGDHPVKLEMRSEKRNDELKQFIEKGYVIIRFLDTCGGTDLGIRLERNLCVLSDVNLDKLTGRIQIVGTLILNDVRVRCTADINLEDFMGTGHLDRI